MITFLTLFMTGMITLGMMISGLAIIPIFKIFIPDEYPEKGISMRKVLGWWVFNLSIAGVGLIVSAFVGIHLPLP